MNTTIYVGLGGSWGKMRRGCSVCTRAPVALSGSKSTKYTHKQKMKLATKLLKKQPWWSRQSVSAPVANGGWYRYSTCPSLEIPIKDGNTITYRGAKRRYMCEECSIVSGENVWLCNRTVKTGNKTYQQELCHIKHHYIAKNLGNTFDTSDTSVEPKWTLYVVRCAV